MVTTSSVGLPNIQSATPGQTPDYSVANSRRGSSQTIAGFAPQERRLGCFIKKIFSLFQFWPTLLWIILKNIHTHKKSAQNVEK